MTALLLTLASLAVAQPQTHEQQNPLYKELQEKGLNIGTESPAKFPAPTLPDGLDAAKQKAAILDLLAGDYDYNNFVRNSVVAPQMMKIRDITPSDPKAPARAVDVWFVVYGDFEQTADDKFLDRLFKNGRNEGMGKSLTDEDLAQRKIAAPAKQEGYGLLEFDFLDRVRIKATGRAVWSRTADSAVAAAVLDPRFLKDAEFPCEWKSLSQEGGSLKLGPPQPWSGAAITIKITKLAAPAGALFVEQHIIFTEPTGWFDGANLLRSKLPPVVQNNVRTMRKEWARAAGK